MAAELHFDNVAQIMRTRAFGEVTLDDLNAHPQRQIAEAPENIGVLYEILDTREVTKISANVFQLVAQVPKMLEQVKCFEGVCIAILSNRDYVYGHANQLASVFLNSAVKIQVFRNEETAMTWLEEQRR